MLIIPAIEYALNYMKENIKEESDIDEFADYRWFKVLTNKIKDLYDIKEFNLDFKEPDFSLYGEFLGNETRYKMISAVNLEHAKELLESNLEIVDLPQPIPPVIPITIQKPPS